MTDYQAEQEMEIEALQAILMDDMEEYEGMLPPGWTDHAQTYKVHIRPMDDGGGGGGDDDEMVLELLFAHTPQYPDEAPCIKPRAVRGLGDGDIQDLARALTSAAADNLGMAMVYTLVTAAQEWLGARRDACAGPDPDAERKRAEEEEERRHAALRAHGTPVTVEAFAAWRARFDAEAALARAAVGGGVGGDGKGGGGGGGEVRLSGKAWFLRQAAAGAAVDEGPAEEEDDDSDDEGGEGGGASGGSGEGESDEGYELSEELSDEDGVLESYLASKAQG